MPVFCLLTACGFHPVYGAHDNSDTPVAVQLNAIAIDNIPNRPGQMLRNDLIDRMYGQGRPTQPLYHLQAKLVYNENDIGQLANATSTFAELDTVVTYKLIDAGGKELLHGTAHSIASFDLVDNEYATLAAHDSAVERTIHEVSEQIVNRLGLYFAERPAPDTETK